jgi:hypothetical protein
VLSQRSGPSQIRGKIEAGRKFVIKSDDEVLSLAADCLEDIGLSEEAVEGVGVSNLVKRPKVELLHPKEISSGALQNLSDPGLAYSEHKGQGYQLQIAETYTSTQSQSGDVPLNLIA